MARHVLQRLLRSCCLASLIVPAGMAWASQPASLPGDHPPQPTPGFPTHQLQCRFQHPAGAPRAQASCVAQGLSGPTKLLRTCRGLETCGLSLPPDRPIILWSPDSTTQFLVPASQSSSKYTFPVFKRVARVTKGPWISATNPNRMVIRWETDQTATTWLRLLRPPLSAAQSSLWFQGSSSCPDGVTKRCMHTVFVNGLLPDESDSFLLGDVAPNASTGSHPKGSFRTEPAVAAKSSYSFSVFGDVQGEGGEAWGVIAKIASSLQGVTGRAGGPLIHTGDLSLFQSDDDTFFTLAQDTLSRHPFFPARGNGDGDLELFLRYFGPTGRIYPLKYLSGVKTYYSLNYGTTHFVFLDSMELKSCKDEQGLWWSKDLEGKEAFNADHIVLVVHHGPRTNGLSGENTIMRECMVSLFKDAKGKPSNFFRKLRLVFSGHQHVYERIMNSYSVGSEKRLVAFITVGTAGGVPRCLGSLAGVAASSDALCENPPTAPTYDYQSINVDVSGSRLTIRAYNYMFNQNNQLVVQGNPPKTYALLDCFALDEKGAHRCIHSGLFNLNPTRTDPGGVPLTSGEAL